ncbi:MAG: hypothetical protein SOR38_07570 [Oscillospiraceae bacterium]|nr:hypothetical protein [Oscillospiraceae bacterium]MDY3065651.1 hypothetical protein [Oscillospiraceae bacterium]
MASAQYIKDLEEANRRLTEELKKQQQQAQAQIRAQSAAQESTLRVSEEAAQRTFEDSAQTAYLQKMLARKELPELLYRQGYNGGLTESALIRLENQYGQAYSAAGRALSEERAALTAQLMQLQQKEAALLAENERTYGQKYADLAYTYQRERAKALEEERAAALKAAAQTSATKRASALKKNNKANAASTAATTQSGKASDGYTSSKRAASRYTYTAW